MTLKPVRRPGTRWARRLRALTAVATMCAVLVGVTGCGLPAGGGIHRVKADRGADIQQQHKPVRQIPPLPVVGADPVATFRGFRFAAASGSEFDPVARAYLAPSAYWTGGGQVLVLSSDVTVTAVGRPTAPVAGQPAMQMLQVSAQEQGTISKLGEYVARVQPYTAQVVMAQVDGQWRVAMPPEQLLLIRGEVPQIYHEVTVYRVALYEDVLVPDQVLLPNDPGTETTLRIRALLQPPSSRIAGVVRPLLPQGTELGDSVSLTDGILAVNLALPAGALRDADARLLAGEVAATMRDQPSVRRVRLLAGRRPLLAGDDGDGVAVADAIDDRQPYTPGGGVPDTTGCRTGCLLRGGQMIRVDSPEASLAPSASPTPSPSMLTLPRPSSTPTLAPAATPSGYGSREPGAGPSRGPVPPAPPDLWTALSVSRDGHSAVALRVLADGRQQIVLLQYGGSSRVLDEGAPWQYAPPTWVPQVGILVMRLDGAGAFLLREANGFAKEEVTVKGLPRGAVWALTVGRDGIQTAAVVDRQVRVGVVVRQVQVGVLHSDNNGDLLDNWQPVPALTPGLSLASAPGVPSVPPVPTSIAWSGPTELTVLSASQQGSTVWQVPLGWLGQPVLQGPGPPQVVLDAVATAPGQPLLAVGRGRLWVAKDNGLEQRGAASSVAYPS